MGGFTPGDAPNGVWSQLTRTLEGTYLAAPSRHPPLHPPRSNICHSQSVHQPITIPLCPSTTAAEETAEEDSQTDKNENRAKGQWGTTVSKNGQLLFSKKLRHTMASIHINNLYRQENNTAMTNICYAIEENINTILSWRKNTRTHYFPALPAVCSTFIYNSLGKCNE